VLASSSPIVLAPHALTVEKPRGKTPAPPSPQPQAKDQYNIKSAMGFRQFLLRGLNKVSTEWILVCLACNVRRLHTLDRTRNVAAPA
jgi:hypothetical protein